METYDVVIVGGGMVGTSLALALENSSLNIAIVEAAPWQTNQQPSYDDRGIALSYGSQRIFETMDVWQQLKPSCTPIQHIHVSDRGHFGVTRLHAENENVPALGQVITARNLGQTLVAKLSKQTLLSLFSPASVIGLSHSESVAEVTLDNGQTLKAKLIVAADGSQSSIRKLLDIQALEYDYKQTAITANVSTERPHQNWAYERFTDTGPVALLPLSENRSSLVWTVKTGHEQAILEADDDLFLNLLQQRFGYRLGRFTKVGQRNSYPLKLVQADQAIQQRIVLIGNAAHSLHPIAGQGFNLGLRDVAALADIICQQMNDCGDIRGLTDYHHWRMKDQDSVIETTNNLVHLFSNDNFFLGHARGAGLSLMEKLPPVKSWLARRSMGLSGKQPRLARGIKL
jgi:2-octaprenyl-6-methoxyphenol hydroxylase